MFISSIHYVALFWILFVFTTSIILIITIYGMEFVMFLQLFSKSPFDPRLVPPGALIGVKKFFRNEGGTNRGGGGALTGGSTVCIIYL